MSQSPERRKEIHKELLANNQCVYCRAYLPNNYTFKSCKICREKRRPHSRRHHEKYRKELCEKSTTYAKNHREEIRNKVLMKKYGITYSDIQIMLQQQHGRCKICHDKLFKPQVDHNHHTRKIRGLLCYRCNHALGLIKENIPNVSSMMTYLLNDQFPGLIGGDYDNWK